MKNNKQRRTEINAKRLARAARIQAQRQVCRDEREAQLLGGVAANVSLLAQLNNTYDKLPSHYFDRSFRCCDCGESCVWTAKQQKWWYETVRASINSRAVRCLPCRRKRRAQLRQSRQGQGADLLGESARWLRSVTPKQQDAETVACVEALLSSKWQGLRKLAIDVLGRWQRPQDEARLRNWAVTPSSHRSWRSGPRKAAVQALVGYLKHPADDAWLLDQCVQEAYVWRPAISFLLGISQKSLDDFVHSELQRNDVERLQAIGKLLFACELPLSPALRLGLQQHPNPHVAQAAQRAAIRHRKATHKASP